MMDTKLILDRIPGRYNEGMFWGNGCMGGLLYVRGREVCFAVDHMLLWEGRDSGEDKPGGTFQDFMAHPELFHDGTYFRGGEGKGNYYRTRLPGLSLSLVLEDEIAGFYGELDYRTALSEAAFTLRDGSRTECCIYLDSNVNVMKVEARGRITGVNAAGWDTERGNLSVLADWGYPGYTRVRRGEFLHVLQPYSEKGMAVLSVLVQENSVYATIQAVPEAEGSVATASEAGSNAAAEPETRDRAAAALGAGSSVAAVPEPEGSAAAASEAGSSVATVPEPENHATAAPGAGNSTAAMPEPGDRAAAASGEGTAAVADRLTGESGSMAGQMLGEPGITAERLMKENEALLARYRAKEADFLNAHKASWASYWEKSDIRVPDRRLQQAYDAEMYKIHCNEREGMLPVTLMGIWNNDSRMPAWCGDLHNDMNVQACYWPAYKSNHGEAAAAYIDYYAGVMPRLTERAEKLFGIKDAVHCPLMMAPGGYGAGGEWCFWNCLLGPELFVAADFIWYYEFTRDEERLESSVYPFLERVIHLYQGIAYRKEDGFLHIPFTNSPEVFKDGRMLIKDDSTVVISVLHYVLAHMAGYAQALGKDGTAYEAFDRELVPVAAGEKGYPLFPGEELFESHRHFCQMFPVFPLGTDVHSDCAGRTLDAVIDRGYTEYASWSFPYLSILASRCGRGNMAAMLLELYCRAFRSRNTFCANGDPNRCGVLRVADTNAGEPSDTFTLEAGFILAAAMSEMFVHRSGNAVYLGYGIPDEWKEASCRRMVIEGGHRISMEIGEYQVKKVTVEAGRTETLKFCFGKPHGEIAVNGVSLGRAGDFQWTLEAGAVYEIAACHGRGKEAG